MSFLQISKEQLQSLRERYPEGTRVELMSMNDPYRNIPIGSLGTVRFVDDIGTVHISWDCGSSLGAAFGEDTIRTV